MKIAVLGSGNGAHAVAFEWAIDPSPGCRFANRCPEARLECTGKDFSLNEITSNHFVSCPFVING